MKCSINFYYMGFFLIFFCLPCGQPGYAQSSDVEVNLDVLDNYTPPPMFDTSTQKAIQLKPITPTPLTVTTKKTPDELQALENIREKEAAQDALLIHDTVPIPRPKPYQKLGAPVHESRKQIIEAVESPPLIKEASKTQAIDITERAKILPTSNTSPDDNENTPVVLAYLPGVSVLSEEIKPSLLRQLEEKTANHQHARFEIRSYASNVKDGQSSARRLSLLRALNIRDYLIANDIESTRIDVRAFGDETTSSPPDRVEIYVNTAS